jgi:hypothetical protein
MENIEYSDNRILREEAARIEGKRCYFSKKMGGIEKETILYIDDFKIYLVDMNNIGAEIFANKTNYFIAFQMIIDKDTLKDIRKGIPEMWFTKDDELTEKYLIHLFKQELKSIIPIETMANYFIKNFRG